MNGAYVQNPGAMPSPLPKLPWKPRRFSTASLAPLDLRGESGGMKGQLSEVAGVRPHPFG
eukprot:4529626-Alexandrium_andersonii.AAC.1